MTAFERADVKNFENRTYNWLCKHWPEETSTLGEAATRERIRNGIERARSYGLESDYQISTFLNLEFLYCARFDIVEQHQWAKDILTNAELIPDKKIDQLLERTSAV
jgi:hypothetical protein